MPPPPPNSSTRRKVLSLPARTIEALDRAQLLVVGLLDGDDVVDLAQLAQQLGAGVDDHPRGDVVHHHRQLRDGRGDGLEVGAEAGPVGLVVVGHDDQRGVGAGLGGHLRQLAGVAGVVGAGAADQQHLVADLGPHRPQQLDLLLVGQGRALAGRRRRSPARASRARAGAAARRRAASWSTAPLSSNGVAIAVRSPLNLLHRFQGIPSGGSAGLKAASRARP